jgi:hypothetical protein
MLNAAKVLNLQKAGIGTAMMMRMAWEGLMKAKKLLLKQPLMDIAGKAKAGLQGPAGFLSWARLEAYQEKLEPARGVSWVRLEAYLGKILKFYRDEIIKSYHTTVICFYAHMPICAYHDIVACA